MPLAKLPPLKIPVGVSAPKGPRERLEAAVRHLAMKGTWIGEDGTPRELTEELAIEYVQGLAERYNTNLYLECHCPRSAAVIKQIQRLNKHAAALANELNKIDNLTGRIICDEAQLSSRTASRAFLFRRADISGLTMEGQTTSRWTRRMTALSQMLKILSEELPPKWARRGHAVNDPGAKRNHFTELEGTAKWRLLTDALFAFERFRPGEATGTEEGDLHQFVNEVYEYATGKEPNDGLLRPLRDLIRPTREQDALEKRNDEILKELEALAVGKTIDLMSQAELKRNCELHKEFRCNSNRIAELTKITWPHSPLPTF